MNGDLAPLEESVRYYEEQVEVAQRELNRAQANLELAQHNLAVARSFYDIERRRLNPDAGAGSRFTGMSLREACTSIVMQKGRVTISDIAHELTAASYALQTRFPGRAIHAALIRAPGVRKVGPATYEPAAGILV